MKVLLVYPSFPKTFWSFTYALKFIGKKAAYPPLGLLTVAAMLPPDWEQRLTDLNVESLSEESLRMGRHGVYRRYDHPAQFRPAGD